MVKVFVFFLLTLVYNICHNYFVNIYMYNTKFGSHTGYIHVSLMHAGFRESNKTIKDFIKPF